MLNIKSKRDNFLRPCNGNHMIAASVRFGKVICDVAGGVGVTNNQHPAGAAPEAEHEAAGETKNFALEHNEYE
ncbi:hypothetical protein D9M68_835790 [compost metagenome]